MVGSGKGKKQLGADGLVESGRGQAGVDASREMADRRWKMGESPYPIHQLLSLVRSAPTSDPTEVIQGECFKAEIVRGGGPLYFRNRMPTFK